MNLPGWWPGFTPTVALNRKNPFLTWAFPLPVAVYDWGVNSNPMTPEQMPQDPVSKARQEAIGPIPGTIWCLLPPGYTPSSARGCPERIDGHPRESQLRPLTRANSPAL